MLAGNKTWSAKIGNRRFRLPEAPPGLVAGLSVRKSLGLRASGVREFGSSRLREFGSSDLPDARVRGFGMQEFGSSAQ